MAGHLPDDMLLESHSHGVGSVFHSQSCHLTVPNNVHLDHSSWCS